MGAGPERGVANARGGARKDESDEGAWPERGAWPTKEAWRRGGGATTRGRGLKGEGPAQLGGGARMGGVAKKMGAWPEGGGIE